MVEHFKVHNKEQEACANKQFISSSSLYLSSLYPYFAKTTTNKKEHVQFNLSVKIQILKIFMNKTCLKMVVETLMIEHFKWHKPSPILGHQWKYNG